jgi:phage terminase large subunit-like protein
MSTQIEQKFDAVDQKEKLIQKILRFPMQEHPVFPCPNEEQRRQMVENVGTEQVMRMFLAREQRIRAEQEDPYRYGSELTAWPDADDILNRFNEVLVLGGNRAGKTEWAAKRVAQAFVGMDLGNNMPAWVKERSQKRGLNIWCLHTTHMTSVAMQQNVFQKYLPKELKEAKRSQQIQLSWSQKNGFTDNTAVYNKNQIWFLNYSQDIKVVEGGEVDLVWCDELVPQDWLETLRYRLVTRSGKLLVTFTPILGYTQVVKEFITTAKVTEYKASELLPENNVIGVPKGHMPYKAEGIYGKHGVVWFHSKLNPYNNWERMKQTLRGRSSHDIKIRAYGWADQTAGSQFPMFGDVNIFKEPVSKVASEGTNYMVGDPAGARNWFMLWARVDVHGIIWVYREWPDQSYGEWALPSERPDGKPGPAQRSGAGRGVNEYTELVWSLETHKDNTEEIAERYIDPRSAGSEVTSKEGGITLLDLIAAASNPLHFIPAAGVTVDERVLVINDLLCYDRDLPIEVGKNHPKLMIHESCQNLIYSMREWTGADGQKGASKDPIDALGYLVVMQPQHYGGASWKSQMTAMSRCGSY